MRKQGKPKTPDALLLIPMAIQNHEDNTYHIINWIDSKVYHIYILIYFYLYMYHIIN